MLLISDDDDVCMGFNVTCDFSWNIVMISAVISDVNRVIWRNESSLTRSEALQVK